jgi:hypothetical protein
VLDGPIVIPLIVGAAALASATLPPFHGEAQRAGFAIEVVAYTGGQGDWGVTVEGTRVVRAMVIGKNGLTSPTLLLRDAERARLVSLVAKLPKDRNLYSFGSTTKDRKRVFELFVGRGGSVYNVGEHLEARDDGPTLKTILEILNLLHTLFGSAEAAPPPPLDWRWRKP